VNGYEAVRIIAFIICFIGFCMILVTEAVRFRRANDRQSRLRPVDPPAPLECPHDWRQVTEFVKQCRTCKTYSVESDAPDGIADYMALLTSPSGRKDPIMAAGAYHFLDPRMSQAMVCLNCYQPIPLLDELPRNPFLERELKCPYCAADLKTQLED
jgi:hypothetical protein